MDSHTKIKNILNIPYDRKDWFRWYGITERRKDSLLEGRSHPNSFFNPGSESTLTLFMLGNIDGWHQHDNHLGPPRDDSSRWDPSFFKEMVRHSKNKEDLIEKDLNRSRAELLDVLDIKRDDGENSILLFEFELYNDGIDICSEWSKKDISFLDLEDIGRWIRYDAVMIFPYVERLIFFESKLGSDLSYNTQNYQYLNQLIKGLESAHLLTEKEESPFSDWDFNYVLICPKILDDYSLTRYNKETDNIGKAIVEYNDLLNGKYSDSINDDCYPKYFGSFVKRAPERIRKIYWEDLANALLKENRDFFYDYFEQLENMEFDQKHLKVIRQKFSEAGIRFSLTDKYKPEDIDR